MHLYKRDKIGHNVPGENILVSDTLTLSLHELCCLPPGSVSATSWWFTASCWPWLDCKCSICSETRSYDKHSSYPSLMHYRIKMLSYYMYLNSCRRWFRKTVFTLIIHTVQSYMDTAASLGWSIQLHRSSSIKEPLVCLAYSHSRILTCCHGMKVVTIAQH